MESFFEVVCGDFGVVCGGMRWFAVVCGGLRYFNGPIFEMYDDMLYDVLQINIVFVIMFAYLEQSNATVCFLGHLV